MGYWMCAILFVMPRRIYIETTIASYLAAWPSRDLLQAARQQITFDWWKARAQQFDLCISQIVLDEAAAGDAEAAQRRLAYLKNIPLLDLTEDVYEVAQAIMSSDLLPKKAARDALHIAVTSVHTVDFLLTWNCRHIANAAIMKELGATVAACGHEMPILCTPEELPGV